MPTASATSKGAPGGSRSFVVYATASLVVPALLMGAGTRPACAQPAPREVAEGITTTRVIGGEPYELAGNRIVFANWYYIQPGDLDWRNEKGESVYVVGNESLWGAHFVGISAPRGIRLVAHKPNVIGPFEMPHRCILQDGPIYRGWTNNEYFESSDGIKWEKKANLVLTGIPDGIYHVFLDPSAPAAERFKAVFTDQITPEQFEAFREKRPDGWEPRALLHINDTKTVACLRGAVSPDGIQWTALPDPLVVEYSDTLNTAYYDTVTHKYVLYTRYWSIGPHTQQRPVDIRRCWTGVGRRAIGRSESYDFRSFPPSKLLIEPTPDMLPSEQIYTNCKTTVPGAPDQHLMFPAIWNASVDDTTRIAMLSSHDGEVWHWVPGGQLLETQPFGEWNGGCIWALPNLIELPDGSWALPYLAHNIPHKYPRGIQKGEMGYAVWPKGRLVAVEALDRGEFTLIPIMPPGRKLKINAVTKRAGGIRVEVAGIDGRSFADCTPIVGDHFWTTVTWGDQADLGFKAGDPITLRFELNMGAIYGLEFE
jgi:hypothetical protein